MCKKKTFCEFIRLFFHVIRQSLQDFAIAEFIANQANSVIFHKSSQIAANFPQILGLDASRDVIAMRIQSKKGCFSVYKME